MYKNWRVWIGLVISLAFLFWVASQVDDLAKLGDALRGAQYGYLVPAIAVYFVGVCIRSVRWKYLLRPTISLGSGSLFPVVVIGYMANNVLPVRMGELVRAYVLGQRYGVAKSTSLATIFVERVFDGLAVLSFMAGVALFIPFASSLQQILAGTAALFIVLAAASGLLAAGRAKVQRAVEMATGVLPDGLRAPIERMAASGLTGLGVMRSPASVGIVMALSLAAWTCEAGMYYLIALGFFPEVPFYVMLLTVAVANLGTMIPSSPGYVGTFDALAVFTLGLFGVAGELAVAYTAVLHATLLLPVTLLGFYYLWRQNLSLSAWRRGPAAAPAVGDSRVD